LFGFKSSTKHLTLIKMRLAIEIHRAEGIEPTMTLPRQLSRLPLDLLYLHKFKLFYLPYAYGGKGVYFFNQLVHSILRPIENIFLNNSPSKLQTNLVVPTTTDKAKPIRRQYTPFTSILILCLQTKSVPKEKTYYGIYHPFCKIFFSAQSLVFVNSPSDTQ